MFGYIYKTTNLINNKIYIGQHKSEKFEPNKYIGSGVVLLKAINKYGFENFKCELLKECLSREEMNKEESFYINKYDSTNPEKGYNLTATCNQLDTVTINNGEIERHVDKKFVDYYLSIGYSLGRNMKTYVNGMIGKTQSNIQKQAVSIACSYKRSDTQRENFSRSKKVLGKFICLRTPDNKSTIRCLIKNKQKYVDLGYIECNNYKN